MGEFVRTVSEISRGYNIHVVVVGNKYGNNAEKIINELFEQVAYDIGIHNIISKVMDGNGILEAEKRFGVLSSDHRPVLLVTQKHPDELTPEDKVIKIQLGNFGPDNEIRDFLFKLARLISSDEFGKLKWDLRKRKIVEIGKHIPFVDIVAVGFGLAHG